MMHVGNDLQQRISESAVIEDHGYATPCWISTRSKTGKGYTKMSVNNRLDMTHRVAYIAYVGPIDEGMVIDHLCRVRACCNPDHLQPVSNRENLIRGETMIAKQVTQTHCLRGHEFTAENTYMRPDRTGRMCRACRADTKRHARSRKVPLAAG